MKLNPLYHWRMWRIRRIIRKFPPIDRSAYGGKLGEYLDTISRLELPPRSEAGSEVNMIRSLLLLQALYNVKEKHETTQSRPT